MKIPRVKKGRGPKSKMTQATYRKKALKYLLEDFDGHCAYCLDPKEFRAPSLTQVDHFDCKIKGRERNYYKNLMLACAACNHYKHDKPVKNPYDPEQRLLNCTEENEFIEHSEEKPDGQWTPKTKAGEYHLVSIGMMADCHHAKRFARKNMAERVLGLVTTAVQYKSSNPQAVHREMMNTVGMLLDTLSNFPPMVTPEGVVPIRAWLQSKGVDPSLFSQTEFVVS